MNPASRTAVMVAVGYGCVLMPCIGRAADTGPDAARSTNGPPAPAAEPPALSSSALEEVVVSSRKRTESQLDVPESITAFSAESLERLNIRSFEDYATKTPNLSFSYGTGELGFGSSRSIAIRGMSGEGTVGVYIDDTPVPDSIDPRVVDVARIEVLKGPQGTLFGQGSMGGNVRIVTVEPSDTATDGHFTARMGQTSRASNPDLGTSFAGSENLIDHVLTARLVGFVDHTGGFITRTYPDANGDRVSVGNQGAAYSYGGSLSLLWKTTDSLSTTLRVMFQETRDHGWAAPYAPLPAFQVQSLIMNRAVNIQEGTTDHWYLPSLTFVYKGAGFTVTSSTSYFDRYVRDVEDGSEGTQWYFANSGYLYPIPANTALPTVLTIPQRRTTSETRVTFDPVHGISGILGVYYSRQYSNELDNSGSLPGIAASGATSFPGYCPGTTPCPSYNSDLIWYSSYPLNKHDEALFGELYYDWHGMEATLGLRGYEQRQSLSSLDMGAVEGGYVVHDLGEAKQTGVTPKAALSYKFNPQAMVYASASKGFRSGGVGQAPIASCGLLSELGLTPGKPTEYRSDTVWSYEIGSKAAVADGRLALTGALFQMNWNNIQQPLTLPECFLGITVNEGAARARGGELELSGHPWSSLEIRAGLGYDDAKITEQGLPGLAPVGSRVVQVPKITGNFSSTFTQPLGTDLEGFVTGDVSYVGNSTSSTASLGYPLVRGGYALVNSNVGVYWRALQVSLYAANITNRRPNLGDLNPASFVAHTSLAPDAPIDPRVATLQPFNAGVQLRYSF